jgi:hypothetical protein
VKLIITYEKFTSIRDLQIFIVLEILLQIACLQNKYRAEGLANLVINRSITLISSLYP